MAYYANRRPVAAVELARGAARGHRYWTLSMVTWITGIGLLVAAWSHA